MAIGTLLLRTTVGGLFVAHGLQKLTGAFEGPGLDGTEGMMKALGMHPSRQNAVAVAATETFGGAALVLGTATPVAAAGLVATMITAVHKVHWQKGPWNSGGGWEFNALLAAAAVAVASDGPGAISLDALIGKSKWGVGGAIVAVAGGVAGAIAVAEFAKRSTPEAEDATKAGA